MSEHWARIPGLGGRYSASTAGRIRNNRNGRPLSPWSKKDDQQCVTIIVDGKRKALRVHRLVAAAFLGESEQPINHLDGNRTNNALVNLEYTTPRDNILHSVENGLHPLGERNGASKLTSDQVREIRRRYAAGGETCRSLADEYGVHPMNIHYIVRRKTWKHLK